jgi:hypothetical protein
MGKNNAAKNCANNEDMNGKVLSTGVTKITFVSQIFVQDLSARFIQRVQLGSPEASRNLCSSKLLNTYDQSLCISEKDCRGALFSDSILTHRMTGHRFLFFFIESSGFR